MGSVQDEEPLRPQPGSQIDPRHAVGRSATTAVARRELTAPNNLLLNDPRRMGKTVWLDLFCASPGAGLEAVKVDYEGVSSADEFLVRTARALARYRGVPARALDKLTTLFDNLELSASAGPITVKPAVKARGPLVLLGDTIESVDAHLAEDTTLVIAMDEVPMAILNVADQQGDAAARELLQTLRELRRRHDRLRWIVCGSVGFHHVIRRCGATEGVINDLVGLRLGPLESTEARQLATRLLAGIDRLGADDGVDALLARSGNIPFLIHALAHRLQDAGDGPAGAGEVEEAFTEFLDDRDDSHAVTHLVTRLQPYYGDDARAAEALLDRLARGGPAATAELASAPDWMLNCLIDDHYLEERRGRVGWRYEVLRVIWAHRRRLS